MKETFKRFKKSINEIVKYTSKVGLKQLFYFFLEMIVIVLIIATFKLPFILIRDLGLDYFTSMAFEFTKVTLTIWNMVWDVSYTLIGIYMFMKIVGKRYENLNEKKVK